MVLLKDAVNRRDCTMTHCQGTKLVFTASRISAPYFSQKQLTVLLSNLSC